MASELRGGTALCPLPTRAYGLLPERSASEPARRATHAPPEQNACSRPRPCDVDAKFEAACDPGRQPLPEWVPGVADKGELTQLLAGERARPPDELDLSCGIATDLSRSPPLVAGVTGGPVGYTTFWPRCTAKTSTA